MNSTVAVLSVFTRLMTTMNFEVGSAVFKYHVRVLQSVTLTIFHFIHITTLSYVFMVSWCLLILRDKFTGTLCLRQGRTSCTHVMFFLELSNRRRITLTGTQTALFLGIFVVLISVNTCRVPRIYEPRRPTCLFEGDKYSVYDGHSFINSMCTPLVNVWNTEFIYIIFKHSFLTSKETSYFYYKDAVYGNASCLLL
jgi:hypothetical protein